MSKAKISQLRPPPRRAPDEIRDFNGDTAELTTRRRNVNTLEELLAYMKVDLKVWEVERHVINKWEMGAKDESKRVQVTPLYQVKAWLRRRVPGAAEKMAETFRSLVKTYRPPVFRPRAKLSGRGEYLYEIAPFDAHLGKLAHTSETLDRNYDCKIAANDFTRATENLLRRAPMGTERILLVFGNDQFNADQELNQTTAGTQQDCDGRIHKTYRLGCRLSVELVDKALAIAPVSVVIAAGNHDHLTSFHLGEFLRAWFRNNPHVSIDNAAAERKYFHYHANLIGFTHGDKPHAMKFLPNLMAHEQRAIWSGIRHKEWHTGHLHTQKLNEIVGVVIRSLSALTPPDQWHANNGYVGNLQGSQAFAWHRRRGVEAVHTFNAEC